MTFLLCSCKHTKDGRFPIDHFEGITCDLVWRATHRQDDFNRRPRCRPCRVKNGENDTDTSRLLAYVIACLVWSGPATSRRCASPAFRAGQALCGGRGACPQSRTARTGDGFVRLAQFANQREITVRRRCRAFKACSSPDPIRRRSEFLRR